MYEIAYNPKFVPVKSPKVSIKTTTEKSQNTYLMRNHATGQYYDLDEASKLVWDLADGNRTVQQIIKAGEESGKIREPDTVVETLSFFAESEALSAQEELARRKRVRVISSFETQVTIVADSTGIFQSAHRIFRTILQPFLFWASMVIVLVAAVIFAPRFSATFDSAFNFQIFGSTVVGFLFYQFVVLAPVIAIHELSHGLALVHYGGRPGEIGTGLFYFGPMFYVDATDSWSLSRRQRIMIMWAGNLSTVLIGAVLVLARLIFQIPSSAALMLDMAAFWCFYSTLWNLAPPFETDGYYMLTDVLNTPDLKRDGFAYLKSLILRAFRRPTREPEGLTSRKRAILLGYSLFSIAFVTYLAIQSLRITVYLGSDAGSWAGKIGSSSLGGEILSPTTYLVGITSIAYFVLSVSGYGVVVGNQVRKSLAPTLRYDALHDRDFSVFFCLPSGIPSAVAEKLESKARSLARSVTSNFTLGRKGPLHHATLRLGSASLPLPYLKFHLRKVEERFYKAYQSLLKSNGKAVVKHVTDSPFAGISYSRMLAEMADKTPSSEKAEVKRSLREFLERQEKSVFYLLSSTFATVWTVEIPPSEQYELMNSVLPGLLVEDLTMTNLVDEVEEFKKRNIYGLDSIADIATKGYEGQDEVLARPDRFQIIAFLEPVKGRITFIGRTEKIERHLPRLGSLFLAQVWSGYFDNLLGDVNLNLYVISKSLPNTPSDLNGLSDGEVMALRRFLSQLEPLRSRVENLMVRSEESIGACKATLLELKRLFQPDKKTMIGLLNPIFELNTENLRSIPSGLRELASLSKKSFKWVETLKQTFDKEHAKRDAVYFLRKRKLVRLATIVGPVSATLTVIGLFQAFPFLAIAASTVAAYVGAHYLVGRSHRKVPRHQSILFTQLVTHVFALTQTFYTLTVGTTVLNPGETMEKEKTKKEEIVDAGPAP